MHLVFNQHQSQGTISSFHFAFKRQRVQKSFLLTIDNFDSWLKTKPLFLLVCEEEGFPHLLQNTRTPQCNTTSSIYYYCSGSIAIVKKTSLAENPSFFQAKIRDHDSLHFFHLFSTSKVMSLQMYSFVM